MQAQDRERETSEEDPLEKAMREVLEVRDALAVRIAETRVHLSRLESETGS